MEVKRKKEPRKEPCAHYLGGKMWKKSKCYAKKAICGVATILFLFSFPFCSSAQSPQHGYCTPSFNQSETLTMSTKQYMTLRTVIAEQKMRLETAEKKLAILSKNSNVANRELLKSEEQLATLQTELKQTQELLEKSNQNLMTAYDSMERQKESLTKLEKQINALQRKQTVLRRQRDVYAMLCAITLGWGITK